MGASTPGVVIAVQIILHPCDGGDAIHTLNSIFTPARRAGIMIDWTIIKEGDRVVLNDDDLIPILYEEAGSHLTNGQPFSNASRQVLIARVDAKMGQPQTGDKPK